jgi:hypothetical protein
LLNTKFGQIQVEADGSLSTSELRVFPVPVLSCSAPELPSDIRKLTENEEGPVSVDAHQTEGMCHEDVDLENVSVELDEMKRSEHEFPGRHAIILLQMHDWAFVELKAGLLESEGCVEAINKEIKELQEILQAAVLDKERSRQEVERQKEEQERMGEEKIEMEKLILELKQRQFDSEQHRRACEEEMAIKVDHTVQDLMAQVDFLKISLSSSQGRICTMLETTLVRLKARLLAFEDQVASMQKSREIEQGEREREKFKEQDLVAALERAKENETAKVLALGERDQAVQARLVVETEREKALITVKHMQEEVQKCLHKEQMQELEREEERSRWEQERELKEREHAELLAERQSILERKIREEFARQQEEREREQELEIESVQGVLHLVLERERERASKLESEMLRRRERDTELNIESQRDKAEISSLKDSMQALQQQNRDLVEQVQKLEQDHEQHVLAIISAHKQSLAAFQNDKASEIRLVQQQAEEGQLAKLCLQEKEETIRLLNLDIKNIQGQHKLTLQQQQAHQHASFETVVRTLIRGSSKQLQELSQTVKCIAEEMMLLEMNVRTLGKPWTMICL